MSRSRRPSVVPPRVRRSLVLAGAVLVGGATVASFAGPSTVAGAASSTTAPSVVLTVPTAGHHAYRHGAVPKMTRDVAGVRALVSTPAVPGAAAQAARASTGKSLRYGGGLTTGGLTGAGVTVGQPKVYLVFMGDQWGTQTTSGGRQVFSNDPAAMAPALQTLFGGLGTGGETWSRILTQYCDGAATGATACVQGDTQVPYPTGGVLAGIWYDNVPVPSSPTGHQLAAEAAAAAAHFGNTDQASNRNTQYVIVSPTGADPDGWLSQTTGYCAYHDDTHDPVSYTHLTLPTNREV